MGTYFNDWVEEAQRREEERRKNPEVLSHPGFGKQEDELEAHFAQWFDYIAFLNEGSPEEPELEQDPALALTHRDHDDMDDAIDETEEEDE